MSAHTAKQITRRANKPATTKRENSRAILRRLEAHLATVEPNYIPRKWGTPKP